MAPLCKGAETEGLTLYRMPVYAIKMVINPSGVQGHAHHLPLHKGGFSLRHFTGATPDGRFGHPIVACAYFAAPRSPPQTLRWFAFGQKGGRSRKALKIRVDIRSGFDYTIIKPKNA